MTADDAATPEPATSGFAIEIIRSERRRKTVQARLVGDRLELRIPASMPHSEALAHAEELGGRLARRQRCVMVDLRERAEALALRYGLPSPASIEWSPRQQHRWGSCTPERQTVRISDRLAKAPDWVLDHVIVHELAHLAEPDHGPRFQALVRRYERYDRAEGFLEGLTHAEH